MLEIWTNDAKLDNWFHIILLFSFTSALLRFCPPFSWIRSGQPIGFQCIGRHLESFSVFTVKEDWNRVNGATVYLLYSRFSRLLVCLSKWSVWLIAPSVRTIIFHQNKPQLRYGSYWMAENRLGGCHSNNGVALNLYGIGERKRFSFEPALTAWHPGVIQRIGDGNNAIPQNYTLSRSPRTRRKD